MVLSCIRQNASNASTSDTKTMITRYSLKELIDMIQSRRIEELNILSPCFPHNKYL